MQADDMGVVVRSDSKGKICDGAAVVGGIENGKNSSVRHNQFSLRG
jgi:hypothetical protein